MFQKLYKLHIYIVLSYEILRLYISHASGHLSRHPDALSHMMTTYIFLASHSDRSFNICLRKSRHYVRSPPPSYISTTNYTRAMRWSCGLYAVFTSVMQRRVIKEVWSTWKWIDSVLLLCRAQTHYCLSFYYAKRVSLTESFFNIGHGK